MSLELLRSIEQAEGKAEKIRAEAQREAREILKSVEEACVSSEREAALEHRAMAQKMTEEARAAAASRIEAAAGQEKAQRDQIVTAAQQRLDDAAKAIFERVVKDGHR